MELNKESLKGYVDTIILSILNEKDCYGYEIAKIVKMKCNNTFELKEGTMYLALKRMESKSLIESYWSQEEGTGGRRKYYKMMEEGRKALDIKKEEWCFIQQIMNSFLGEGI
ncbi:PadR family transcriptional regulator [Intestinibacter sp.]